MLSDESLVSKSLEGDMAAFEELVNRYKKPIFNLVYRMVGQYQEAEDITQEVFINVYEKLYQFDSNRKFSSWIYKIATNASISTLRKRKKVTLLEFDETFGKAYDDYYAASSDDPQFMFEHKELKTFMDKAINELSENYRIVIILRYQMDLTNQEIADILGISKQNVEVRVHRARKALRKIIQKYWKEEGG